MDGFPHSVHVDGNWTGVNPKTIKNKLQIYFQSKKKSGGADCQVEVTDHSTGSATVYFKSADVRDSVLARSNHEITLEKQTVKLTVSSSREHPKQDSQPLTTKAEGPSDVPKCPPDTKRRPEACSGFEGSGTAANNYTVKEDAGPIQSFPMLLKNVPDDMTEDMLLMMVDNASVSEEDFSLEVIREMNSAVVTFRNNRSAETFLTFSQTSLFQEYGLTTLRMQQAQSVRVENVKGEHTSAVQGMLVAHFQKNGAQPSKITVIPEEKAAIVTFDDAKIVETITNKVHFPFKVYPYFESLGIVLYGKERPTLKMPEPFTERIDPNIWNFMKMEKQEFIKAQMKASFCSVDMESPKVKLSPLPTLLKQRGLTEKDMARWKDNASSAFCNLLRQYTGFTCLVNPPAWKLAEKDVRLIVKTDVYLVMDASRNSLTVAGKCNDIQRVRDPVEKVIEKAMSQIERKRDGVSEQILMPPAKYYIMQQAGLQEVVYNTCPEIVLSYQEDTSKLTISGLAREVNKVKSLIVEMEGRMPKKKLDIDPHILDFLKSSDCMEMSQHFFTQQGISAAYDVERGAVFLTGSSAQMLTEAEKKVKSTLSIQDVLVTDQGLLRSPEWNELKRRLEVSYNTKRNKVMDISLFQTESSDTIKVCGFINSVKEASDRIKEFMMNCSKVQEYVLVKSSAVVQFIQEKKSKEWANFATANELKICFDHKKQRITLSGAPLHVQKAKAVFESLSAALSTDDLKIYKQGAKKYFLQQGGILLSKVMKDTDCVVVLHEDSDVDEGKMQQDMPGVVTYCTVPNVNGIMVSVSKTDICRLKVDAVVNAANEDLQHIGGLALALLKAAGPQLQNVSDDYIARHGSLQAGDAVVTDSYKLPCKYVVHAVGPRYHDYDPKTAVLRLKLAVKESFRQAAMSKCSTIAMPAVSSGIFGFPLDLCADTIAWAVRDYCEKAGGQTSLTKIHLVDTNDKTVRALAKAVYNVFHDFEPKMSVPQQVESKSSGYLSYQEREARPRGGKRGSGHQGNLGRGSRNWTREEVSRGVAGRGSKSLGTDQKEAASYKEHYNQERGAYKRANQEDVLTTIHTQEGLKIVLKKGNIQDQSTDVIVNTISDSGSLKQGAVSSAILSAAGPQLQSAVSDQTSFSRLAYGDVIVTDSFKLRSKKVFHAVCPYHGTSQAKEELIKIIRFCLNQAETLHLASISFPALGTGNLGFPKALVAKLMLEENQSYSKKRSPVHLQEVAIVVHPSDTETVARFIKEFKGQAQDKGHQDPRDSQQSSVAESATPSKQPSASSAEALSPSPGAYRIKIGSLTLEVLSGDITSDDSDVIVNPSNQNFNLKSGVSKAILDKAGSLVEQECSMIVNSPNFKPSSFIITSAGWLASKRIIHIMGQKQPNGIMNMVLTVLKACEDKKVTSVAFPALGTGQGGASPSAVANAMIDAVEHFVKTEHQKCVRLVKIIIFQTTMVTEFQKCLRRREGQEMKDKTDAVKSPNKSFHEDKQPSSSTDAAASLNKSFHEDKQPSSSNASWEKENFEPAIFHLCADKPQALMQAKQQIQALFIGEQPQAPYSSSKATWMNSFGGPMK